jgi:Lrp/AsnC family leucine-responsive transcriptional regulator
LMTGDSDYLLRVMASDIEDLENLIVNKLSRIPGIASIRSNLALKKIVNKNVLPIDTSGPVQIKPCRSTLRHGQTTAKPRYDAQAAAAVSERGAALGVSSTEEFVRVSVT